MTALDTITAYLSSLGLSRAGIAGVEGNLQVESGFNPGASNPREGAIGLAQWEGGRRTALQAYARAHGTSETDLSAQLGYLGQELQGPFAGVLAQLRTATDPGQAAALFDSGFERSSGDARSTRMANAQAIYGGLGMGGGSTSGPTGNQVVDDARQYLGIPYVTDAMSRAAVDCSGLVKLVFQDLGVSLPRTAQEQSTVGTAVDGIGSAQPGDLLFFGGSASSITHVGIYVGNGMMEAAPEPGDHVKIQSVYETPTIIRRVTGGASTGAGTTSDALFGLPSIPGLSGLLDKIGGALSRWALDAGLIVGGVIVAVVGLVLIAKAGDRDVTGSSSPPSAAPQQGTAGKAGKGGEAGTVEDAAVVA